MLKMSAILRWRSLCVATLLIFLPTAVGIVMGPRIASLYFLREKLHLQNIIKKTNCLTFAATLLLGLIFCVFAKDILSDFWTGFPDRTKGIDPADNRLFGR